MVREGLQVPDPVLGQVSGTNEDRTVLALLVQGISIHL